MIPVVINLRAGVIVTLEGEARSLVLLGMRRILEELQRFHNCRTPKPLLSRVIFLKKVIP
jgi:hypothetical protein